MEIDKIKLDKDVLTTSGIELSVQEKQEYKLLGQYGRTPGLRVFCYNHTENTVTEVEFISSKVVKFPDKFDKEKIDEVEHKRANVDGRFEYFEALNKEKAERRLRRFKEGKIKSLCNLRPAPTGCIRLW